MVKERSQPFYMISIAAELAGVHPQTLRIYEREGFILPTRSPGGTRLYSEEDIKTVRTIQELTREKGVNLAGAKLILRLRSQIRELTEALAEMEKRVRQIEEEMEREVERVRKQLRQELSLLPPGPIVLRRKR
jgi:MerR family transcriptional regulator/heat shock protein HspR